MSRPTISRAAWLVAGLGFLWPAALNGFPFLFYDTTTYLAGANFFTHAFFGAPLEWAEVPTLIGRSVYYGTFLLFSQQVGGFWVAAAAQGLLAAGCVAKFLRYWPHVSAWSAFALLQATTLPFFASFILPDVLTGLAILSATALLLFWRRDGVATRAFWITVASAAALSHPTNPLVLIAMAASGLVLSQRPRPWLPIAMIVAAAVVGVIGEAAFAVGVTRLTGSAPLRPPYVTAHLTTDGPGTRYLRETCPANGFAVCHYVERLPAPTANDFLWNPSSQGVFKSLDVGPEDRRLIAAEDGSVAWATFRYLPMATLTTLASGTYELLRPPELEEFNYYPYETGYFQERLPAPTLAAVSRSRAFSAAMPTGIPVALMRVLTLVATLLCARALLARSTPSDLRLAVALILVGFLVNAAVCGGLAGPYGRYQERIMWLLPFAALLTLGAQRAGANAQPR